jgi:murein tripeptide amidase MpaA
VEVPLYVAKHLAENYATDPHIRDLVDQAEVWIVPLLNPDGLEYTIHFYRYWRKNMRDNENRTYGVDPNRNYDYMWGNDNEGSSAISSSYVYRGPAPFSEPETQAIRDLFAQRDFQVSINYHNYSQVMGIHQ